MTNRIGGGVIGIHLGAELGVEVGAAVDGARGGAVVDDGDDVEGDGAHVEKHAGDVQQRGEEKDALSPDQH